MGRRPDGRPMVREVYGATQREVRDKLADLVQRHRGGTLADASAGRQTLSDFLDAFQQSREGQVREGTQRVYAATFRLWVVPELGGVRLADLRAPALQAFYGRLLRRGLAPSTVAVVHARLRTALKQAVEWDIIPANPADRARPPAVPRREGPPPTPEQVRALLRAAREAGDPLYPLWAMAACTGGRVGELCALRWRDVALPQGEGRAAVRITRTLLRVTRQGPVYGPVKASASRRALSLLPGPTAALRALKEQRAAHADDLVFLAPGGGALGTNTVSKLLRRAWGRAGLGPWRFHDLRHYAATTMLEHGVEPQTVALVLGHSSPAVTLNLYAGRRPERVALAVDALAVGLDGGADGGAK